MLVVLHEKHDKKDYYYIADKMAVGKDTDYRILSGALQDRKDAEKRLKEIQKELKGN